MYPHAAKLWLPGEYDIEKQDLRLIRKLADHVVGTVELVDCVRSTPAHGLGETAGLPTTRELALVRYTAAHAEVL